MRHPLPARSARVTLLVFLVGGLCACAGEDRTITPPPEPQPGVLTYGLVSPTEDDGGVLFVAGAAEALEIRPVEPAPGDDLFTATIGDSVHVGLVRLAGGPLRVEVRVPDVADPPDLRLVQVVGPGNRLRPSLDGYRMEVLR